MRVLIVDDEPLARTAVRNMLHRHPDIEIVAECEGGADAVDAILSRSPDFLFLDIQMPEVDGFQVLEAVGRERMPHVVFVTAYDRYAVRAFDAQALDYLLKPFDAARFDEAVARARQRISLEVRGNLIERFIIRTERRVFFLPAGEIDWIEAQGNYVNLHAQGSAHLFREPLGSLAARLDPRRFRRIHRSTIVNLDSIRELRPCLHGDYEVILREGAVLRLSHRYRSNLEKDSLGDL
jgi:two-component system LytT family response regulator